MKIVTRTKTGFMVTMTVTVNNTIRCELAHPKMGKIISSGSKFGTEQGQSGLITSSSKLGKMILTVPIEDVQPLLDEINKKIETEKNREKQEYEILKSRLPKLPTFYNTPDEVKFNNIMNKVNNSYYSGSESDGLNLSVSAHNSKIRKEAMQYCDHEIEISYYKTYTADSRKLIERTVKCKKCGLYIKDSISEELSNEAIWS